MPISSNEKELTATPYIPYTVPFDEYTNGTVDGDVVRTIQLVGAPFETLSNADINGLSQTWLAAINSAGAKSTRVALWTHLIRRKLRYDISGIEYDNWFSQEVNNQYAERLVNKDFFTNELFISPVFRPAPTIAERYAQKLSRNVKDNERMREQSLTEIDAISRQLMAGLRRFQPILLGTSEAPDGTVLSETARLYSRILNGGESGPIRVNNHKISYAIQRNHITFDGDIIEIEMPSQTKYAGILSLKAPYSTEKIRSDIFDGLIKLPCEFIMSQSFTYISASKAEKFLTRQLVQIKSTSGNIDQIKELEKAITDLQNGKFAMGEHEFILTVYGDSISEVSDRIELIQTELEANKSLEIFRETRGTLISQYFSMLPGNFKMKRLRAMPVSTNNFSSFFSMHNFITGNAQGSQWGMPIAMLETTSGSPYFVNYHLNRNAQLEKTGGLEYKFSDDEQADPDEIQSAKIEAKEKAEIAAMSEILSNDESFKSILVHEPVNEISDKDAENDGHVVAQKEQRKESGNYISIGINGSGKTVTKGFLHALTRKVNLVGTRPYKNFTFDKDEGQHALILALGGQYFTFESGKNTGLNLFSLEPTAKNILFILKTALWCARTDETYVATVEDERHLLKSITATYRLTKGRRWARIRDLLPKSGIGCLHSVLGRWVDDGPYAWVLDSPEDRLNLEQGNDFGFDMTSFLEDDYARTPILSYIKHKISLVAPGSPYSIDIDEASHALRDEYLSEEIIEKDARTIRKKLGLIGLHFQNASDVTEGRLAPVLKQQFPTFFIFPNPRANPKDFIDGLNCTAREFDLIKNGMLDEPGKFLLKKGDLSVVVRADLGGMNDILSILSGSADNMPIVLDTIARFGNDPKVWVPAFFKRRA